MDHIIFAPRYNTGKKKDATGAFQPEARAYIKVHGGGGYISINNEQPRGLMAADVLRQLALPWSEMGTSHHRAIVFFCHGYTHGIQFGIRSPVHPMAGKEDKARFDEFVKLIAHPCGTLISDPVVILYACSTGDDPDGDPDSAPGSGDGSFADTLRDRLCQTGATNCRVVAHTTAGHTTKNPNIKIFDGRGSPIGGAGGASLCVENYKKGLKKLLATDWRFLFPFMSIPQIYEDILKEC